MPYNLKLKFILLADDDNSREPVGLTPANLTTVVGRVNTIFASAGIVFDFDPVLDIQRLRHTQLNSLANTGRSWWVMPNALASLYPGRVVVLFRWGPSATQRTGNGFAYPPRTGAPVPPSARLPTTNVNFVAMPNGWTKVNLANGGFFAHELGHYLGLFHTFPGWSMQTIYGSNPGSLTGTQAQQRLALYIIRQGGNAAAALDGDGLPDTRPDPGDIIFSATRGGDRCAGPDQLTIQGQVGATRYAHSLLVDRANVMSYFTRCATTPTFSATQITRMEATLNHPYRLNLLNP